ncbi:hypothetical protein HNR60_001504 [Rhodopseudomonas rhenobacensis]|uniref:Uncharacterized protein n=1 Tax=Rhodopseudomonas rhenobacensis TaxID=87461 RepID=A0A7W7Z2H5_9BRAD|nr:phage regulatory CII family protein [Rhodopseudomonas rhenobacensis]MBB5046756.1 hypothetical protein [Rhodopseudomonas rhenobacensis]
MAPRRRDTSTLDLFRDVEPTQVVRRFDAEEIKAWSAARRLSRAIAAALDGFKREEVAIQLSEQLGEAVSKATLDAYASPEKPHAIPAHRLAALYAVTADERLLNALLNEVGLIAVPAKYEALLKRERARELKERAERDEQAADAEWRARR